MYQTKRNLRTFSNKLTQNLSKSRQKFYLDLLYGISKSQHIFLSEIARSLNEAIDLTYTIKRLSRNAAQDEDLRCVHSNYLDTLHTSIPDNPLVIVDESDIAKPYAEKMEALGQIHDGSKKTIEKGYTTINFALSTAKTKHPLSLYTHVCSAQEDGFESMNVEKAKGFNTIDRLMDEQKCTFVMDRLYDSNDMFNYVHSLKHFFITRLKDNRYLIHKNRRIKVPDLANRRKGKINFRTEIQGVQYALKVSHIQVKLPTLKDTPLNMVVVYGYGKKPMKLLTNHIIKSKKDVLWILKGYITRWRIEELFRVQKQEFKLEKIQTMLLSSLRILYTLLNCIIGHYSLAIEKKDNPYTDYFSSSPILQCLVQGEVLSLPIYSRCEPYSLF
ncbi:transposase [Amphibacillus sp. Q70]|uniref:transposase n=1 Tax=Amphibacillus sp. Q70 TaxID=3453416 RepID=UPI003F833F29